MRGTCNNLQRNPKYEAKKELRTQNSTEKERERDGAYLDDHEDVLLLLFGGHRSFCSDAPLRAVVLQSLADETRLQSYENSKVVFGKHRHNEAERKESDLLPILVEEELLASPDLIVAKDLLHVTSSCIRKQSWKKKKKSEREREIGDLSRGTGRVDYDGEDGRIPSR